jgi:hypothetical protein
MKVTSNVASVVSRPTLLKSADVTQQLSGPVKMVIVSLKRITVMV